MVSWLQVSGPIRFGRYDLHERLAVGGMGELFLARLHGATRETPPVVLKILLVDYRNNADFVKMFQDEARIGMQLAHPNIVGVQESGEAEGTPFIVLEYVEGENMRNVLRALTDRRERLPAELAVKVGIDMLLALDHAHRAKDEKGRPLNLVHRDLSPDNVLIGWDGTVKILDFGIAKAEGRATRTQFGVLKGKAQYMAPEQALGGEVDARSDLYAVALVVLEAITGEKRFDFDDAVKQIVEARSWKPYGPSERDRTLPVELDAILLKALQVDPARRWQTADEFAAALTRILRSGTMPRAKESLPSLLRRVFDRRQREADRPTTEAHRRAVSDDEGTVPGMGPSGSDSEPTVLKARPLLPARDEPTYKPTRLAVNLAERPADDESTAAGRPMGPREPAPTDPGPRRKPIGAVSDPGWAKNAGARDDDEEFATAVTNRGDVWSPEPEEVTGETEVPPARGGVVDYRKARPQKRRRLLPRLLLLLFLSTVFVAGAGAATWTFRDRLPPEARARMESVRDLPQVRRAIALAEEKGLLARFAPTPTPVDLIVGAGTSGELAMASPEPQASEGVAMAAATVSPTASPSGSPKPTPTAVAMQTVRPSATAAVTRSTPRATPVAQPVKGASVRVVSTPPGFEILVDGRGTGKRTPATVVVPAGNHTLSIEAEGFKVWSFQEELRDGDTLVLQANLIPR